MFYDSLIISAASIIVYCAAEAPARLRLSSFSDAHATAEQPPLGLLSIGRGEGGGGHAGDCRRVSRVRLPAHALSLSACMMRRRSAA